MAIRKNLQSGVTLIEMLVVVGIIALVSSIMIFNYSDFSSNVSLRNLSQEIALGIRKAQTYATSVRAIDGIPGVDTRTYKGYGISFSVNADYGTGNPDLYPSSKQFVMFADTIYNSNDDPNGIYEPGNSCGFPESDNECLEKFSINTSDIIYKICAGLDDYEACGETAVVDITYNRPSPDAKICYRYAASDQNCSNASYTQIWLRSIKGLERSVLIYNTGQISVQ